MEEHKELLELLQKIEKANRQQVKLTRFICIFARSPPSAAAVPWD